MACKPKYCPACKRLDALPQVAIVAAVHDATPPPPLPVDQQPNRLGVGAHHQHNTPPPKSPGPGKQELMAKIAQLEEQIRQLLLE